MRLWILAAVAAGAAWSAQAQVRCKMPNGVWIEQRMAASCPAGAKQAQTMDGKPLPLRLPAKPAAPAQVEARPAPRALPPAEPERLKLESSRRSVPFDSCVLLMTQTVLGVGGSNVRVIVSAPEMRMLRICTNDGSVLITCSRDDSTMVTTKSPHHCD